MSYPEFKSSANKASHHSRGGYYKNWQEPNDEANPAIRAEAALKQQRQKQAQAQKQKQPQRVRDNDSSNEDEPTPAPEPEHKVEEEDDMPMLDPALREKGKEMARSPTRPPTTHTQTQPPTEEGNDNGPDDDNDAGSAEAEPPEPREDIQILDLHSDHPYIAYKGRLFEGDWAEVIGTEAILAVRDEKNPLPALRHLAENVDLLAASSVRLLTKEKTAKAKEPEADPLAAVREEWNIRIPVAKDRTGERRRQAQFLENLIALKKMKGEEDGVTVYAVEAEGKDFDDDKDPDYRPRRKRTTGSEAPRKATPARQRRAGGRPRGGRRARAAGRGGRGRGGASRGLSTPTPTHWDDDVGGEGTGEGEDENDDGDVSMGE